MKACSARARRRERGNAVRRTRAALLELQAVAALREAEPRHDRRRRRGRAGAARGRDEPAAGRRRRGARRVRRRATRSMCARRASSWSARGSPTTPRPICGPPPGRHSAAVRELLPRATAEAVHRDYFVPRVTLADGDRHRIGARRSAARAKRAARTLATLDPRQGRGARGDRRGARGGRRRRSSKPTRSTSRRRARRASRRRADRPPEAR